MSTVKQVLLVGVLPLSVLAVVVQLYRQNRRRKGECPVHRSWVPFIGSAVEFGMNPGEFVSWGRRKYGPVFSFTLMGKRLTVVTGAVNHEVFFMARNAVFSPREVYKVMKPVFGPGVVYDATSYERMREQLNFVAVELNMKNFQKFVPLIREETISRMNEKWGESGELNMLVELSQLIVQTASRCLLGPFVRELMSPEVFAQYLHDLEAGLNPLGVFYPWLPSPGMRITLKARDGIAAVLREILKRRRESKLPNTDVLGSLLEGTYTNGERVTEEEAVGILIGAMFAGQHTSLIVSSWTAMFLANNKPILEQLRKELVEVRKESGGEADSPLELEHLNRAALLEACVKESLRIHPPLVMLMRAVLQEYKVDQYKVRPGDIICMSPAGSMRDETIYADPGTWDPMRFLPPREEDQVRPYSFVGFGAGSHRCLGEKFGMLQVRTVIATIFEHYEITPLYPKIPSPDYASMVVGPYEKQCQVKYTRRRP